MFWGTEERFEPPKPCGARPESVVLPWAFQVRPEEGGREALLLKLPLGRELLLKDPLIREFSGWPADGGRLDESCDCRELLKVCVEFPPRPKLPAGRFPPRFGEKEPEFMVRTGMCEAPAAGVERAITARFCTPSEGVATRPCMPEAPRKLACVGEALMPPATRALRVA